MKWIVFGVLLGACSSGEKSADDTGVKEGCGDPTLHDITVQFAVEDESGNGVSNIDVRLEERNWDPGVLGESTTDGQGMGDLLAVGVTDLPNCWGTMLSYMVVVEDSSGYYATAEKGINSYLHGAIEDGSMTADLTAFPIVVTR